MPDLILPIPPAPVSVRVATPADVPFMDGLQKKYGKALGYFPLKQFEGYVDAGNVLIAEEGRGQKSEVSEDGSGGSPRLTSDLRPLTSASPLGYIISKDRYLKRDELGVIYQLCVAPGAQRKFVGAALVREAFERSAYGCRLYCCWCAQDLAANRFWESLGFVPLAFRAGSTGKKRVHIFWQKRICEGDLETKWWYPFQTNGGAIRADRIVLPIPPGVHWSEVRAPEVPARDTGLQPVRAALPDGGHGLKTRVTKKAAAGGPGPGKVGILVGGRIKYVERPGYVPEKPAVPVKKPKGEKAPPQPAPPKLDPKYLAAVRELRDRYLEHVNANGTMLGATGKYDVSRALPEAKHGALPRARDNRQLPRQVA